MDKELRTEFRLDGFEMRAWREDDIDAALEIVLENREHLQTYMQWMTPEYSREDARRFSLRRSRIVSIRSLSGSRFLKTASWSVRPDSTGSTGRFGSARSAIGSIIDTKVKASSQKRVRR